MGDREQCNPLADVVHDKAEDVAVTPERWQQIKELFGAVLERSPDQRGAFLQQACGPDESLRAEVESLLAEEQTVATSAGSMATSTPQPALAIEDSMIGRRLGAYEIIRRIGQGGMAAVYLAGRADDQYRKQVAIKLVTLGFDNQEILRRFRNERQTLAALDHPNIVKLLDGGTTAEGVPYLVMDYVEGVTIDDYCDEHKLSISDRLRLFCSVCAAVQYAHQTGVIHRDLKPSNILVTADGAPKLLDFGIAKVLNPDLSSGTLQLTQLGMRPLTPAYASPEQVRGEVISYASDVYTLGVVLYELLTGHHPYRLKRHTPKEIERVICEMDPERPSAAVSRVNTETAPDGASSTITPELVSQTREGEPEKLRRSLRGDLDNIVLRALQKEPQRRYASVKEFSSDIGRHLEHRPVKARKSTLAYRVSKFVKRYKSEVAAAPMVLLFAILLVVVAGGVFYTLSLGPAMKSIAILPFTNLSGSSETEYLSDGITEALINDISQLPNLKVISGSSVLRYRGKEVDPQTLGHELQVRAVLTGKYAERGSNLIISVELSDTRDNHHIWGEQYNRNLTDIAAVQEEISRQIADMLRLKLTEEQRQRIAKKYTDNPEAYQLYLKGLHYQLKDTPEDLTRSRQYYEQAIDADPNYALAYAGLSGYYGYMTYLGELPPKEGWPKAEAAAIRAVELDPTLGIVHSHLGTLKLMYRWDWAGAEREIKRALELDPNEPLNYSSYSMYLRTTHRFDEAVKAAKRGESLDPLAPSWKSHLALLYYYLRNYAAAEEEYRQLTRSNPDLPGPHLGLYDIYSRTGKEADAIKELQQGLALQGATELAAALPSKYASSGFPAAKEFAIREQIRILTEASKHDYISPIALAINYAVLDEKDNAFAWLEKAYEERAPGLLDLDFDPDYDNLRTDKRFHDLKHRINLPQ
jgi:eukaryotic-like serine/threonine-protein kinase